MPANYSHYAFGKAVIEQLDDAKIKDVIQRNLDIFYIGLHGPDILFFYKPYKREDYSRMGHILHKKSAYPFFNHAKKVIDSSSNPESAMAYILGFICHFILDSICHGYVQQIIEDTGVNHLEIEAEYDRRCMQKDNLNPLSHPLTNHIKIDSTINATIAPFFHVDKKIINTALKSMKFYDHLFLAPSPIKRGVIYSTMKVTFLYKYFQGLVMNYKPNSKLDRYFLHFDVLFNDAIYLAVDKIKAFYYQLPLDDYYYKNYK